MKQETERLLHNTLASFNYWGAQDASRGTHVSFLEDYKSWERAWDEYLAELAFLPDSLIKQARELTRIESRLAEGPLFPTGRISDLERVRLYQKLELMSAKNNWSKGHLLIATGLATRELEQELDRMKEAASH